MSYLITRDARWQVILVYPEHTYNVIVRASGVAMAMCEAVRLVEKQTGWPDNSEVNLYNPTGVLMMRDELPRSESAEEGK